MKDDSGVKIKYEFKFSRFLKVFLILCGLGLFLVIPILIMGLRLRAGG